MNLTDRRKVKNTGSTLIVTHGYTFLPGQIITIPDKIWYGKEMWKVANLEAEPKNGSAFTEGSADMLNYGIAKYLAEVTAGTTPTEKTVSGITYQGYVIKAGENPMIFFKEKPVTPIPVESISMSLESQNVTPGGTTTGTVTFTPATATNKEVTWNSSDETVATVSENEDGTCTVTVKADATVSATCRITATSADGNKTSYKTLTVISGG